MTNVQSHGYAELTTYAESQIRHLMDRTAKLAKPQQLRHTAMAHGALALWRSLVDALHDPSNGKHDCRVQADHERLKALIRRPDTSAKARSSARINPRQPARDTYGVHWHRVQRVARTVLSPSFGTRQDDDEIDWHAMWEDVVTSAFIHLHQLKDWFPEPVNGQANAFIDEHEPLQICADLANTAKHAWLDPARGGARASVVIRPGGPAITIPLGRSAPGVVPRAKVEIRIAVERDGVASHRPAAALIVECFQLWRQFIMARVVAGELDNVEYGSVWINEAGRLRLRTPDEQ